MVICAKVQMTGNWQQIPDCVIISPSTTACSSASGKEKEKLERKEDKKYINKYVKITATQTKTLKQVCIFLFAFFWFVH